MQSIKYNKYMNSTVLFRNCANHATNLQLLTYSIC